MLSFNPDKKNCSGCAACRSVCPKDCISMLKDEEGFEYPVLTSPDLCTGCKLCEKVCHASGGHPADYVQEAYAAVARDYGVWHRSASGGAFSEICRAWGDGETLIAGAAWDGLSVRHVCVTGTDNIGPLCGSKYVASSVGDTFRHIRSHLQQGGKAVFCGTPCQVSGLRSYLRKDYGNLLTIDLICHGVGSPDVFQACARAIGGQAGSTLQAYSFRAKRRAHETDYLALLDFGDRKEYAVRDQYIQLFLRQTCLRPSCGENCKFRGRHKRPGDFTIADFKGLTQVFPDLVGSKRNYSTIVTNSPKATALVGKLEKTMEMRPVSIEDIARYNPLFDRHTWFSTDRDAFFSEFVKDPDTTVARYTVPYTTSTLSRKRIIYDLLPTWLRRLYSKLQHTAEK